jgi:plastocyanin
MKETLMTRRRARAVAAGVALALVATLVACGDDPSDEGEPAGGDTTAAESSEGGEGAESTEAAGTTVGESAGTTEAASTTAGGSASSAAASTATTAAPGPAGEVTVVDFSFDPEEIEVTAGGTVTWTNEDDFAHEIVATDSENPFAGEGEIDNGQTYTVTFAEVGTYDYFCGIHNSMTGSIVVV